MWIFGVTLNIYSQIGIIMLIGLVSKNGILIVEFANQRQNAGLSKHKAIVEASVLRLRPILMTSITTILALTPFLFTGGMGSDLQRPLALAIIGGMLVGTIVSLYFIPLCYYYLKRKVV